MSVQVFFSDFFGVDPAEIQKYGSVDISLVNDIPLFIDPFLLFNSQDPRYQALHEEIIQYVSYLRDKAEAGPIEDGLLKELYCFPEVKQLWLGFCLTGNGGAGLGLDFARKLHRNLRTVFSNFGEEQVTAGSHLEKVCLIERGVGKDNISDFSANLIKAFLVDYTRRFAERYLSAELQEPHFVERIAFNYETESWVSGRFVLPTFKGDFVLLAPREILTKDDTWINKSDFVTQFEAIRDSVGNDVLRAKINNYFRRRLPPSDVKPRDLREAAVATIEQFPELIEYFIRYKEKHGDEAAAVSRARVSFAERRFITNVRGLSFLLESATGFYTVPGNTKVEARARVEYLQDVIENKGGWKFFYVKQQPVLTEDHLHILFRLTWLGTPSDLSHEVDDGRGPADFKVSRGAFDKTIVEFKLARNKKLKQNLEHQVEAYKQASDAEHGLKVILYFSDAELARVTGILKELGLEGNADVYLIDGRADNKPSASNVA